MKNNNKCYAAGCDNNNIDYSCMYGNTGNMPCRVNCYNCAINCKKIMGVIGCKKFINKHKFDK